MRSTNAILPIGVIFEINTTVFAIDNARCIMARGRMIGILYFMIKPRRMSGMPTKFTSAQRVTIVCTVAPSFPTPCRVRSARRNPGIDMAVVAIPETRTAFWSVCFILLLYHLWGLLR